MIDRKQVILFCLTVCIIPICFFSAFAQEVSPSPQTEGIDSTGVVLSLAVSPSVVQPGGQVTVTFSGIPGNEKDWIGIYAQDTSDRDYSVWKYCDGKKEGSLIFDAPTKEGTYEFRVFESDTVHRIGKSDPFVVRKINISLTLNKESYDPGEEMEVIFTAPASYPTDAWVGIIPSETPHGEESVNDQSDITYQYLEGKTSGTLGFVAPSQPGLYDVRMHDTDSNGKEVASVTFTVATLQSTPDGEAEKRSQAMKLRSEGIALQKEGKYQEALEKYWESVKLRPDPELEVHIKKLETYINKVKTIVTPPPQPSPVYTPVPSLPPEGDKSGLSASPDTLNPGKPITVTFSREEYGPQAWIGFFKAGDPDGSYREWSYLKDFKSDSFTVIAPKELGKYDFRIFQDAGYIRVAISHPVLVVQYQPVIKLLKLDVYPGEKISVTYGDPPIFQDAWIGFYQEGSPDNGYRSYSYLRDLKDSTYTVDAPKELGRYNFRIFLDAGYVLVGVSESVKVKQYQPSFTISQTEVDGVKKIVVRFFNPPIFQDAWIGFYQEGSPDNGYRSYSYLRDLKDSTYTVDAPKELGRYNFRMFLDAGYVLVGVSESVMISK